MAGDGEGPDGSDASDDQAAEAAAQAAEAASAIGGEGPSGGEGFGGPGFGGATDIGGEQTPPSVAETAATEDIGITPTPTATEQTAATEDIGAKKGALASAKAAQQAEDPWGITRARVSHPVPPGHRRATTEDKIGITFPGIPPGPTIGRAERAAALGKAVAAESKAMGLSPLGTVDEDEGGESTPETIRTGIRQAQENTPMTAEEQFDRNELNLKSAVGFALPGVAYTKDYTGKPGKLVASPMEAVGAVVGAVTGLPGASLIGGEIDASNRAEAQIQKTMEENTRRAGEGKGSLVSLTNPFGARNPPSPDSYPGPDGIDPIPKRIPRTRAIAATNNNVGLAVDDGDFTRKQLRRARRQITRFA